MSSLRELRRTIKVVEQRIAEGRKPLELLGDCMYQAVMYSRTEPLPGGGGLSQSEVDSRVKVYRLAADWIHRRYLR